MPLLRVICFARPASGISTVIPVELYESVELPTLMPTDRLTLVTFKVSVQKSPRRRRRRGDISFRSFWGRACARTGRGGRRLLSCQVAGPRVCVSSAGKMPESKGGVWGRRFRPRKDGGGSEIRGGGEEKNCASIYRLPLLLGVRLPGPRLSGKST
ncbi:hypothetical protein LX32DRAFT_100661 [Colletotrichum zoysiae]|uniref:Uncharacterized protein n=1 Tax=Colletotrichum zoysiae TaxID=1216348 RepID=A0AAD9H8G8_9PEZI|nr:hypothetical protein LX32DRAFT_100661 [Colletotrichum zoysiae]